MRLIKPAWLGHRDEQHQFEIYSADVSPDGKRLATGGLDTKVRIWSTAAIEALAEDKDKLSRADGISGQQVQRQLSSMSSHSGAVTVVRFSPNGRYLASGSDDKVVLIWELDASRVPQQEFGSKGEKDSEVWAARKRLTGHDSDVQDLAWSPDGSLLVTVGLDSAIIVWSGTTFEKLKRIDSHDSHVKGVTFDPANKYFLTASDDRSARIIRYVRTSPTELTFSVEAVIEAPFTNSPLSTYFRRCSWSPNGEYIACANATNGPVPTVTIVNRGEWDSDISLIGHEGPCEVTSFSPRIYSPFQNNQGSFDPQKDGIAIVASGGHDRTLAIWNTASPRPLLVAKNISEKPISDIAWAPDGQRLYVASLDGTITMAWFTLGDLGWPISKTLVQSQLQRYGGTTNDMDIPESVEQLAIEEKYMGTTTKGDEPETVAASSEAARANQVTEPVTAQSSTNGSLRLGYASTSGAEQRIESAPAATESADPSKTTSLTSALATAAPAAPKVNVLSTNKQKVTVTKDGRKRVAPTLITQEVTDTSIASVPSAPALASAAVTLQTQPAADFTRPSHALPQGGVATLIIGSKRKGEDAEIAIPKKHKDEANFIRPAVTNPAMVVSQVRLATPKVVSHLSTDKSNSAVLEVRNGETPTDPAQISVINNGRAVFVDYVPGYAHILTGSVDFFWAVATEDGSVYTYTPEGRRLLPTLVLGAPLTIIESRESFLIAITATGMVHAWDLSTRKALFAPTSLAPVLDSASKYAENGLIRAPTVTQCIISASGHILITLSNGSAYTYDAPLLAWQRVSEPFWAYGSMYWDSTGFAALFEDGSGGSGGGLVTIAERRTNEEALLRAGARGKQFQRMARNRMLQDGYQGFEDVVSIAHLENRVNAAAALGSGAELGRFLEQYVRRLAEDGLRDRLNDLFLFLLGDGEEGGEPTWGGRDKHELLSELLRVASSHRAVQSLVVEYDEALVQAKS